MPFRERASNTHGGFLWYIAQLCLRFCQFIMAITVIGLYGQDLNAARIAGVHADGKWVFAVVVATLAALTALIFMIPFVPSYRLFPWDFIIFILWAAVLGLFGNLYIHEDPEGDAGIVRMKNAVWVDLTNMLLWLISTLYNAAMFFKNRHHKSLHTGRAVV